MNPGLGKRSFALPKGEDVWPARLRKYALPHIFEQTLREMPDDNLGHGRYELVPTAKAGILRQWW